MKRNFSKKQRMALANHAGWKCTICNTPLDNSFHADHIIPYSKGGITDVSNGQALCPTCNMQKGNKMSKKITWDKLRPFQQKMFTVFTEEVFPKKDIGILNVSPGGGKTVGSSYIANHMLRTGKIDKIIVVVPTTALVTQWKNDIHEKFGLELIENFSYDNNKFKEDDGFAMTYAGVVQKTVDIDYICSKYRVFLILDEAHHLSDDDKKAWGKSINEAFSRAKYTMMLTGTPWRHSNDDILHMERDENGHAITDFKVTKRQLLGTSLRWTEFDKTISKDIEFTDNETGEDTYYKTREEAEVDKDRDIYGEIVRYTKQTIEMFKKADKKLNSIRRFIPDAAGLIVAPDIDTAKLIAAELSRYGDYPVVHSKKDGESDSAKERIEIFKKDRNTKWIIAVDMIAEGIDIPRLQVCVFTSAKRTTSWLWQVIARMERRRKEFEDSIVNDTAYFYYVDDEDINSIIENIEHEQKKVKKKDMGENAEGGGSRVTNLRADQLTSMRNEDGDIVYNNVTYKQDDPVTIFAVNSFVNDPALNAYDFSMLYNFARAAMNAKISTQEIEEEESTTMSNSEIRDDLKEKIDMKLKYEMGLFMNSNNIPRDQYGKIISIVRRKLNSGTGEKGVDGASIASLEKQLEILFVKKIEGLL